MPKIFISYRRADSEVIAGRIYDHLEREFGADSIFKDVDDIEQGENFLAAITEGIQESDVMLVILGKEWLAISDEAGSRRLDNPEDFVRYEVTSGLEKSKSGMLLIPLLVDGASMPAADDLPEPLKPLAFANAAVIRNDPDFRRDLARVISRIKQHSVEEEAVREREQLAARQATRRILSIVAIITVVLTVLLTILVANGTIRFPGQATATIDAVQEAFRLLTSTAEAEIAQRASPTPDFTATIDAILTIFPQQTATADAATQVALAPTETPSLTITPAPTEPPTATATLTPTTTPSLTPSLTPSDTPTATANATLTLVAAQTQVFATVFAQATNDALATLRAPTNTPEPSDTPTATASVTQTPTSTATASETPTPTQTPPPSPTATQTPTAAPSPTFTATSSPSPSPTATTNATQIAAQQATALANAQATVAAQATESANIAYGVVAAEQAVNVRAGAGTNFPIVTYLQPGTRLEVVGSNAAGDWLNVRLTDGTTGWVANYLVAISTPVPAELAAAFAQTAAYDYRAGNAAWTPITHTFEDAVTMVLVPEGCFMMGSDSGDNDELPIHEQCFDAPFWIDLTEVTQVDFERLGGQKNDANEFDGDLRPVESITWLEARVFCSLRGARLPTEREWEYAARGPENLIYPWGNSWNDDKSVWVGNSSGQTVNVGNRPAGASWVGGLDMSGNVWEWVNSLYQAYPYVATDGRERDTGNRTNIFHVLRGGSWVNGFTAELRAPGRFRIDPYYSNFNIGFRCARDY